MINFFKKLFVDFFLGKDIVARVEYCEGCGKMLEYCICKTPTLLLAAPDLDRYIEPDFFAHCIVHTIEERLEALIAKPNLNMYDTAIEIAELEETYNRVLPKLISYKHDPIKVRIRKL